MSHTLDLTKNLINRKSVTPEDAGCQEMMANILKPLGFEIEDLTFASITGSDKQALVSLGFTPVTWDCYINQYEGLSWNELATAGVHQYCTTQPWE